MKPRVPLAIAAGVYAGPVSELALGLMIAVNRRMLYADRMTRQGVWLRTQMRSLCFQLDGQAVGLLGFGASGRMTARLSESERAMLMGGACAKTYRWSPKKASGK